MAAEPDTLPSNLTIGAVCRMLGEEFDEISISKIRFLEDQKLIAPRRTPGGYRLFSADDVERLRAILRMQRDEFLPLAVIRDMLTQGATRPSGTRRRRARARRLRVPVGRDVPWVSMSRITASGRNSSRCMRRIARSRSTSSWLNRRYPPGVRRGEISF